MFENKRRWPAAALAVGLVALAGCGVDRSVASKSAAAFQEAQKNAEPGKAMGQSAGQDEHAGHAGHAGQAGQAEHAGHAAMSTDAAAAAPEAVPPGQPAATLKPDALDAPAATSVADAQRSAEMAEEMSGAGSTGGHEGHEGHGGHGGHGGGAYVQVDAGRETAAQGESHDHHGHGMTEKEEAAEVYVCPMHPEVTSATPGKCPKCGMDLVKRRKG